MILGVVRMSSKTRGADRDGIVECAIDDASLGPETAAKCQWLVDTHNVYYVKLQL